FFLTKTNRSRLLPPMPYLAATRSLDLPLSFEMETWVVFETPLGSNDPSGVFSVDSDVSWQLSNCLSDAFLRFSASTFSNSRALLAASSKSMSLRCRWSWFMAFTNPTGSLPTYSFEGQSNLQIRDAR